MTLQVRDTGLDYVKGGSSYPLVVDPTGQLYIHDPNFELGPERRSVRQFFAAARSAPHYTLGYVPTAAFTAAATAAEFIPVVGQVLGPIIGAAGALFGGGDPTALSVLIGQIVQLRAQLAQLNNQQGIADSFVIPPGFNAQDKSTWANLVEGIVEQAIGVTAAQIQSNRRADYYSAISALKNAVTQAQQGLHDQQLIDSVTGISSPVPSGGVTGTPAAGAGTPSAAGAVTNSGTSSGGNLLLLGALGIGAIALLGQ